MLSSPKPSQKRKIIAEEIIVRAFLDGRQRLSCTTLVLSVQ